MLFVAAVGALGILHAQFVADISIVTDSFDKVEETFGSVPVVVVVEVDGLLLEFKLKIGEIGGGTCLPTNRKQKRRENY